MIGGGGDLCHRNVALANELSRTVQPAAVGGPAAAQFPPPVGLFGDVGEMEVERKGTGQLGGSGQIDSGQPSRSLGSVGTDQATHLFDQVQQALALLTSKGLTEQPSQPANVRPEGCVEPVRADIDGVRRHAMSFPG